jgi:hypothetical protein
MNIKAHRRKVSNNKYELRLTGYAIFKKKIDFVLGWSKRGRIGLRLGLIKVTVSDKLGSF